MDQLSLLRQHFNSLVVGLFCAGFCSVSSASENSPSVKASQGDISGKVVLIVGDSLSAEYGLTRGTGWVNLMSQQAAKESVKVKFVNASISGDTSSGGVSRLPQLLTSHKPQLLVVELGGNDALRGLSMNMTQQNLITMAREGKKSGAKVLIVGMQVPPNYGANYTQQMAQTYQKVSQETGAELNNQFLKGIADDPDPLRWFQSDRIHPNEGAQSLMMKNIWPQIKKMLATSK
jgi:acyl-CoA thioesterase-1